MRTGVTISAVGHAAFLLCGLVAFAAKPFDAKPMEIPVDIVSAADFTKLMAGVRSAAKADAPKALVEKVGAPSPVEDATAKIVETKEIRAATDAAPPPPPPEVKPAEAKPPVPKAEPKRDLIAEAIRKDAPKKAEPKKADPKKAETKKAEPKTLPKTAPAPQPKFDPRQVEALLDRRAPQRLAAAGDVLNTAPALGSAAGAAAELSQSEIDALRRRLSECWSPPVGAVDAGRLQVVMRVLFKPDGTVAKPPDMVAGPASTFGPAMAESAKRAILLCQPYDMLKPEHYEQWKDIEITFDPLTMIRG